MRKMQQLWNCPLRSGTKQLWPTYVAGTDLKLEILHYTQERCVNDPACAELGSGLYVRWPGGFGLLAFNSPSNLGLVC